jgi:hypothetical protein
MEASVGLLLRAWLYTLVLIGLAPYALAEDGKANAVSNITTQTPRSGLTGKERLGPKWTDEQRIDNCHVPFDKRGRKSRPDNCPNTPSS